MFAKDIYIARRRALVEKMAATAPEGKRGVALFVGNVEAAAQYKDNAYKFRQDSSWLYYFGLDEPRMGAIIDLDSGEETLYADDVEIDDIIWMGPQPSVASKAADAGIYKSASYGSMTVAVTKAQKRTACDVSPVAGRHVSSFRRHEVSFKIRPLCRDGYRTVIWRISFTANAAAP